MYQAKDIDWPGGWKHVRVCTSTDHSTLLDTHRKIISNNLSEVDANQQLQLDVHNYRPGMNEAAITMNWERCQGQQWCLEQLLRQMEDRVKNQKIDPVTSSIYTHIYKNIPNHLKKRLMQLYQDNHIRFSSEKNNILFIFRNISFIY